MKLQSLAIPFIFLLLSCNSNSSTSPVSIKKEMPKELKEISGIVASGTDIWAITDKPKAVVYKLDSLGNLVQEVEVKNATALDVEAITGDEEYLYLGDVGDNTGDRQQRKIIKVSKANIGRNREEGVEGDSIIFNFPGEEVVESKKQNNFDCESLLSFKDSLYLFTKDREDGQTKLFSLPKAPGNYVARLIDSFDSKGLITDAAINASGNEVALIGYHKGHTFPFIYLFSDFKDNNFFSGKHQKIELADKDWDWQLESFTYGKDGHVYFACEGTEGVAATFYGIKRADIMNLNKAGNTKEKDIKENK